MKRNKKGYGIVIFIASLLWVLTGIVMSLREPGDGKGRYRETHDLLVVLGVGMMMIQACMAHLLWHFRNRRSPLVYIAILDLVGGAFFLAGGMMVFFNPGPFPYLLFSGYLISMAGLILTGVVGHKQKLFSATASTTIIVIGACLLFFNDQYLPWVASVLGGVSLWFSYLLFYQPQHFRTEKIGEPTAI